MNKNRFLFILMSLCFLLPNTSHAETVYTPPPMFGGPVVTPETPAPASVPVRQEAPQPQYKPQPQALPQPEPIKPTAAPVVASPAPSPTAPAQQQTTATQPPADLLPKPKPEPASTKITPTTPSAPSSTPKPKSSASQKTKQPTKSVSAEDLLNHPVTATQSPNAIDPLMASEMAKRQLPQPKDGEVIDDTGVDPSKVSYPTKDKKNSSESSSSSPSKKTNTKSAMLNFGAATENLTASHKSTLDKYLIPTLSAKPKLRAQILSYATPRNATGNLSARRVSLTRGLAVRSYLLSKGIHSSRLDVRALGEDTEGKGKLDQVRIIVME